MTPWNGRRFIFKPTRFVFATSTPVRNERPQEQSRQTTADFRLYSQVRTTASERSVDYSTLVQMESRLAQKIDRICKEQKNAVATIDKLSVAIARLAIVAWSLFLAVFVLVVMNLVGRERILEMVSAHASVAGEVGVQDADSEKDVKDSGSSGIGMGLFMPPSERLALCLWSFERCCWATESVCWSRTA